MGMQPRARDLGVPFDGQPGPWNAITDVPGVEVGFKTLNLDKTDKSGREISVRTGVTAVLPRGRAGVGRPCIAATHTLNGNGEMTGRAWIEESGTISTQIAITNTHSVGEVHGGCISWMKKNAPHALKQWALPVVAETWDGYLNDINGQHVTPEDAMDAIDGARSGVVSEGNVGGGTGMNSYGFKGGTGTASRLVQIGREQFTLGVLVQANHGARRELVVSGVKLGASSKVACPIEESNWLEADRAQSPVPPGAGSIIVVVGTDAPLLPNQLQAILKRVPLGLARNGTTGSHFSGYICRVFNSKFRSGRFNLSK